MTLGFFSKNMLGGLAFRVLLFLSLALLPIGLISVIQTREISKQSSLSAELSLLSVTEQAAKTERTVFQEAFGAVQALGSIVDLLAKDPKLCSAFLGLYQLNSSNNILTGFVGTNGQMTCVSSGQAYDLSKAPLFENLLAGRNRAAIFIPSSALSPEPAVVVSAPVFHGEVLWGHSIMSIPNSILENVEQEAVPLSPLALVTFNAQGQMLSSEDAWGASQIELPKNLTLKQLAVDEQLVFKAPNGDGVDRAYAVLPLVSEAIYVLSVWPTDTPILKTDLSNRVNGMLPVFMWIASLIVAFWALNRLAIRHIRGLVQQMRYFALNRTLPRHPLGDGIPNEIVEMEDSFIRMAESILRDEAIQEDNLRDRNILLKEVHHRVKNNLQLISSIMNMQIRQAKDDTSREVLQRLQDRILSLATVHKSLYQGNELNHVNGAVLLREIVNQVLAIGMPPGSTIEVKQHYDPIKIDPDDAAPLTLLVSEAMTNAIKYLAERSDGTGELEISLTNPRPQHAVLRVFNTTQHKTKAEGTGLGTKLIQAFSRQLNGTLETEETDDSFELRLDFPVPDKQKAVLDY